MVFYKVWNASSIKNRDDTLMSCDPTYCWLEILTWILGFGEICNFLKTNVKIIPKKKKEKKLKSIYISLCQFLTTAACVIDYCLKV